MPPFDIFNGESSLAAMLRLADERDMSWRRCRKGVPRPAYDVEHATAQRRANVKARQLAAAERTNAAARKRNHTARPPGEDIQSRMLLAMELGKYYGQGDLVRLIGAERNARGKVHAMVRRGWLETVHNPAYSGSNLNPWEIMGGAEPEPARLYRLTAAGLARREAVTLACTAPPAA